MVNPSIGYHQYLALFVVWDNYDTSNYFVKKWILVKLSPMNGSIVSCNTAALPKSVL